MAMDGSLISLSEHDRIIVRPIYKHAIPTAHEVRLLLDLVPDYTYMKIALGLLATSMIRPSEVMSLRWNWFKIEDDTVKEFRHYIYKPKNRKTMMGRNYYFKSTIKPMYSKWLSDQIVGYAKKAPSLENNKMFPWTTNDALTKWFATQRNRFKRGELGKEYEFLLDTVSETVYGRPQASYRIGNYALRRFAISFHYYMTYGERAEEMTQITGHANVKTVFDHYIKPKESFGLTQQMIDDKISIDQFIHLKGKHQMMIPEFVPEWNKRFTPVGQSTLFDFTQ